MARVWGTYARPTASEPTDGAKLAYIVNVIGALTAMVGVLTCGRRPQAMQGRVQELSGLAAPVEQGQASWKCLRQHGP